MEGNEASARNWGKRCALTAVLLLAVVAFGWLLWRGPFVIDRAHLKDETTPGIASVVTGFRTMVVAVGAGCVAVAGLIYTHRTLKHTREKDDKQAEQTQTSLCLTRETLAA